MENKQKDSKKKTAEHEETLLPDFDVSLTDIDCETCGVSFSNVKSYEAHMQGKKHRKKLAEAKFKAKSEIASKKETESDGDDINEDPDQMYCEVCDKYFTGYMAYVAHSKGSVHAKNVKKEKLKKQLANMPEVVNKDEEDSNSDSDGILQKPYAVCATCQKKFSGPEPFKMHLKSVMHHKKVKQSQTLQKLKVENEDEAKNSDDDEFYSKCDVCQKSFSGLVPYQIHMQSNAHKRSLEKKKVAEEIKNFCANDDVSVGYVCKECKKIFTDPLAFKCHLQNNSHEKRKAKDALLKFLDAYPEIVFVTPLEREDSGDESDSGEHDMKYYFICKLCHVSFTGPESAQDHVKSKKHINIKKEKKMFKLLKDQKKNLSLKSENKNSNSDVTSSAKEVSTNGKPKSSENGHEHNSEDFELL